MSTSRGNHTPASSTGNTVAAELVQAAPERRERPTGHLDHLERTGDPARVPGLDRGRGLGIEPGQLGVRVVGPGEDRVAYRAILGREGQRIDHRLQVQAGATGEQGAVPALFDLGDGGAGLVLEPRHRPFVVGVGHVDEVVAHRGALGAAGLRGADVEPAVDLHRVDRHDLDVTERSRDLERERRLPGGSGADDREVRAGHAGAAVTGMRMRTGRGAGSRRRRSPRSQCGAA